MKLTVNNVQKKFDKKEVLKGLDYTFEKGHIIGLLGRNGAGKTTFFNCLNQDLKVDDGTFMLEEENGAREVSNSDIGYVVSTPRVPEFLTGREFLKFFLDINKDKIEDLKSIDEYFELVKIAKEDRDKLLKDYSHGMKNKMQMLINIIANPNILLLDEPLTSLDVVVAEEMKRLLKSIKKDHIIIFSTHIMELAISLCDEIVVLSNGKFQEIKKGKMNEEELKNTIIDILKEEENYAK